MEVWKQELHDNFSSLSYLQETKVTNLATAAVKLMMTKVDAHCEARKCNEARGPKIRVSSVKTSSRFAKLSLAPTNIHIIAMSVQW